MVTPFRFRAVTSRPRGKWRSIFLTGGVTRSLLRISLSSIEEGDVFSFLFRQQQAVCSQETRTYQPVFCVSMAISIGIWSFSTFIERLDG